MSQLILDVPDDCLLSLKLSDEAAATEIRLAASMKLYELGRGCKFVDLWISAPRGIPRATWRQATRSAFSEKQVRSAKTLPLAKIHEASWWNGKEQPGPSQLDHAFAGEHLRFERERGYAVGNSQRVH